MMITIVEAISDLLFLRDTVVVPGLGAFVKKPVSAKINPVANHFAMPTSSIGFDPNLREDNDLIVNYLSERNDIPKEEAKKMLAVFVSDSFNLLKSGKKLELNGIGVLYYDWADDLIFEQAPAVNYNSDAFGLCDFTLKPVLHEKTKDEIKEEIAQQQKDKNTPVTVDEEAVHQYDGQGRVKKKQWWLAVAAIFALVFCLYYFNMHRFDFGKNPKDNTIQSQQPNTEQEEVVAENDLPLDTVEPIVTDTFSIIAGCYDQEEFAQRIVVSLQNKGFEQAFKMKRGERWFVAYGWYPTEEEAIVALREIRTNTEYKGWILSPRN